MTMLGQGAAITPTMQALGETPGAMPGAAAAVGVCSGMLPPALIAEATVKLMRGERS